MAIAGRILIIPKGDYDANASYTMLDLVSHNGTSWLARKDATGIEPSEANSEYWQRIVDFNYENAEVTYTNGVVGALFGFKNTMHKKLAGQVEIAPSSVSSRLQIGQLASDYFPPYIVPFTAYNYSRGSFCGGRIDTDGKIYLEILSDAVDKDNSYRINVSY